MSLSKSISTTLLVGTGFLLSFTSPVFAHLGHLGDLAGHSHWAGIALVGAAAAVAGLLAKGRGEKNEDAAEGAACENDGDTGDEVHA